jgi:DNA uptake protein ComE-like DNA-binding protein
MEQNKRGEQVLVGKHEVKILFGMPRRGLKDNIKTDLNNGTGEHRMDLPGSGEGQGMDICEHRNERSGFRTTCKTS